MENFFFFFKKNVILIKEIFFLSKEILEIKNKVKISYYQSRKNKLKKI